MRKHICRSSDAVRVPHIRRMIVTFTYLFVKFDPCRLKLFSDVATAEWILELSLAETLVLLGLASHGLAGCEGGRAGQRVQRHCDVLAISYLF